MLVSEIVAKALRLIGVVGHGQTATAEQIQDGVLSFNLMLHGWALDGLDLTLHPDAPAASIRKDYEANEPAPVPSAFLEGTIASLAARIAPEYMVSFAEPDGFVRRMQAALISVPQAELSLTLRTGTHYPRRYIL